jgi:hypothetical protein
MNALHQGEHQGDKRQKGDDEKKSAVSGGGIQPVPGNAARKPFDMLFDKLHWALSFPVFGGGR